MENKTPQCFELTLTTNYVNDWTLNMAFRELIQNGTDQELTNPKNKFELSYDSTSQVLRFISPLSKLKINTLLLGRSSKTNDDATVGQFGEGYKLAALVLTRLEKSFTIYNNEANEIWKSRFKNSKRWLERILAFYVEKHATEETGLVIEVGNISQAEYNALFDIWLDDIEQYEHVKTSYGDIITDDDLIGSIFVNGIYITQEESYQYGYNFKPQYLDLERDRKTINDWNAKNVTARMFHEAMLNGHIKIRRVERLLRENVPDVSHMDWCGKKPETSQMLIEEFEKQNPGKIPVKDTEEFERVRYMGGQPLMISNVLLDIISDFQKKKLEELKTNMPKENLTNKEKLFRFRNIHQKNLSYNSMLDELDIILDTWNETYEK